MYILSLLIATLSCILISCSNDNDKNLTNQSVSYLSSIISENQTEVFDYDKSGKIKEYRILSNSEESKTSYIFENTNEIRILNIIKRGPSLLQVITYDETMHLESGLAMYVEGEFKEYKDSECLMHKKYRQEFKYNNKNQLINITQTEWNRDNNILDTKHPWTWKNYIYWENDRIVKYEDYNGSKNPIYIQLYEYSELQTAKNTVILPNIRPYYMPLYKYGIFGDQPLYLISKITSYNKLHDITTHKFIDYSLDNGLISAFTITARSPLSPNLSISYDYIVGWREFRGK